MIKNMYSFTVNTIKNYIKRIIKYRVNLHPFHSTTCLCCMEDNDFIEVLRNFESIFEDNSGAISFDDFNENSDDDEMMTAREDSDSSNEEWTDANNVTTMNISLDHENDIFHVDLEEQCISSSTFRKQNNFFHDGGNEKTESHIERKNESKIQEGKRSYPQSNSIKSHSSKTSKKQLKRKSIKYRKTTQTDNYSSDDKEVIPIKAKRHRKRRYRSRIDLCQFQSKNTNEELNYMADDEDSDGSSIPLFQSFSWINSGFENRASETYNMNDIENLCSMSLSDGVSVQELRENPLAYIFYPQWMLLALNDNSNSFPLRRMTTIPPAPSPMRHLYYEYPEFMTVPVYINISRIINICNLDTSFE